MPSGNWSVRSIYIYVQYIESKYILAPGQRSPVRSEAPLGKASVALSGRDFVAVRLGVGVGGGAPGGR